jgi:hypothetical protein
MAMLFAPLVLSITTFRAEAQAQQGSTVVTNAASYSVGETATITASGLPDCAGVEVQLGFFALDAQPILVTPAVVAADGTIAAKIKVSSAGWTGYAGVSGDCLADGIITSPEPIVSLFVDPPDTGTGVLSQPGSDHALAACLVVAGLLLSAAGAFAFVRR